METINTKHIIWVTPGFAATEQDSQCIPPMQLLAKALMKVDGLQLHIISLHYPKDNTPYQWHGTQVYPCARKGPATKIRTRIAAFRQLTKLLKQYPTALLHSFWMTDACLVTHLANRRFGVNHLVTLMGQDARPGNRYLKLLPSTSMTKVGLSLFHADQFQKTTGSKVDYIIPWGVAAHSISSSTSKKYDVIGVGSLIPLKQYDYFIDLLVLVKKTIPSFSALLVGDGPERQKLEALATEKGLADNLTFTGALPREEVLSLMAQSKVFLHTSSYESFGFVLVEALQQGAQVVATPVGIAPELSNTVVGTNSQELFEAIIGGIHRLFEAENVTNFSLSSVADAYLELYTAQKQTTNP
ncbi:glycosyltransferase [Lewinella cohaerens]|uniref:glycosyltransferase n=1 Tax=Lewinella cohaerens TaxID=70995 RepID=UPI0012EC9990|nr:glycosyltransferase [Lewinella cohaerens]